jgi:hypothetical protein
VQSHGDKVRLNIRIDADLIEWARDYARRNRTSVTALIVRGLQSLMILDQRIDDEEAPQI